MRRASEQRSPERGTPKVLVRLMGGLGNQLFQFAAGLSLAWRLGDNDLGLDLSWFRAFASDNLDTTRRDFGLGRLLSPEIVCLEGGSFPRGKLAETLDYVTVTASGRKVFREKTQRYDRRFEKLSGRSFLIGYFQSPKYLYGFEDRLRQLVLSKTNNLLKSAPSSEGPAPGSLGVHVRRGDYISHSGANRVHGFVGESYFARAMDLVMEKTKISEVRVFSDDPEWVLSSRTFSGCEIFQSPEGAEVFDDLLALAACDHHVISNSTFGWWGAWLSNRDDQVVVMPKPWFQDDNLTAPDLVVPGWFTVPRLGS